MGTAQFAVIDVETTGFGRNDRVIEIGVVHVDADLNIEREWSSLVNPRRDVGPTWVHGLRGGDLDTAPSFDDLADELIHALAGRVIVAHNAAFDRRMLNQELERHQKPALPEGLCTYKQTRLKLVDACQQHGIALRDHHSALADARATAALFAKVWTTMPAASQRQQLATTEPVVSLAGGGSGRSRARPRTAAPSVVASEGASLSIHQLRNKTIAFSGDSNLQLTDGRALKRPLARQLVAEAGMTNAVDITHGVDYLVTPDIASPSKKARHARSKGVTIIDEIDFWRALNVATCPRRG